MEENITLLQRLEKYERQLTITSKNEALIYAWGNRSRVDLKGLYNLLKQTEEELQTAQERYDRLVERHYDERYERWFEQVSDRYRRRIRRLFFRIRRLNRFLDASLQAVGQGIIGYTWEEDDIEYELEDFWNWVTYGIE